MKTRRSSMVVLCGNRLYSSRVLLTVVLSTHSIPHSLLKAENFPNLSDINYPPVIIRLRKLLAHLIGPFSFIFATWTSPSATNLNSSGLYQREEIGTVLVSTICRFCGWRRIFSSFCIAAWAQWLVYWKQGLLLLYKTRISGPHLEALFFYCSRKSVSDQHKYYWEAFDRALCAW